MGEGSSSTTSKTAEQTGSSPSSTSSLLNSPVLHGPKTGFEQSVQSAREAITPTLGQPKGNKELIWNTEHLSGRIGVDLTAAASAGAVVAPIVSIIDRGIIENASGRANLPTSILNSLRKLAFRPHMFFSSKQFLLIFAVYGSTYLSANFLDTYTSTVRRPDLPASHVTHGTSKFAATSVTNLGLSLVKDNQFAKMFGASSKPSPVPPVTFGLFMVRDALTVFASFNAPPLIAPMLPMTDDGALAKYMSRASAAQFLAPAAVQILSTPLHLLGLDLYNRPNGGGGIWGAKQGKEFISPGMRASRVLRDWAKSCIARVCRILPAFGVGGVVNTRVRKNGMTALVGA